MNVYLTWQIKCAVFSHATYQPFKIQIVLGDSVFWFDYIIKQDEESDRKGMVLVL